jgi:hypothetical protein
MAARTNTLFQPHLFLRDLVHELKRNHNPAYPAPAWHVALAIAEREDFFRQISETNAKADPHPVLLVSYIDDPDPKKLILNGSIRILREPHESQDDRNRRLTRAYQEQYRDLILAQRRVYYWTHKERMAAQHAAYYQRNRKRLKEKAKKTRDRKRAAATV